MKKLLILLLAILLVLSTVIGGISCSNNDNGDNNGGSTGSESKDTTAPVISGITVSDITDTTAAISWTTDESATGNIEYGLTTSYGISFPSFDDATADKTSHHLILGDLSPNTTYHFCVQSEDAKGNEAISVDQTFTTTPSSDVTVDEQVVFSQEGITITVKSLDLEGSFFGPELKVLIENQNAQDITVQAWNVAINDVMVDSMFSCDVVSGKAANDGITFEASSLETAGIETIKDIEFEFDIFNSDSWNTIVHSDTIEIRTSVDDSFVQEYDDSGSIALDENGIKVVIKGLDTQDSIWGPEVLVYIENNTGQDVTIQVRDVSVNGFMIDPMFSCDILDGKKAFDSITFLESDLTDGGITTITTIELSFDIFNPDTWETIFNSDMITISF